MSSAAASSTFAPPLPTHPEENKENVRHPHSAHPPTPVAHLTALPHPSLTFSLPLFSSLCHFQHLAPIPPRIRNGAGTYSAPSSVNGHAPAGGLSQISPLEDEDEHVDTFDTMKDLSPSPRSYSQSHSTSPYLNASHSFYTPLTTTPDLLSSVDRSLLPILAPFNFLDSSTLSSRLAALNITRGGFVEKKQSQMVLGSFRYNRRYLLLKDNHLRYDASKKENPLKGGMDLRNVRVERSEFDAVTLVMDVSEWWKHNGKYEKTRMAERKMEWKCDSEEDREGWIRCIEESKMMHEVYPLNKGEDTTPFPIALILGVSASGKSTVFKHVMAWRPSSYQPHNPNNPEVSMANKQHSYSSLSPRVGEQVKHAVHHHRHHLNDVPQEGEGWMPIEVRVSWKKRIFMHVLKGLCVLGDAVDEHAVSSEFVYAK